MQENLFHQLLMSVYKAVQYFLSQPLYFLYESFYSLKKALKARGEEPSQVIIHTSDGNIQQERTYERIFRFFEKSEKTQHEPDQLKELYTDFFEYDQQFDTRYELFTKLSDQLQFVNSTTPYEEMKIIENEH